MKRATQAFLSHLPLPQPSSSTRSIHLSLFTKQQQHETTNKNIYRLVRIDDNGNEVEMERNLTKTQADALVQEFTTRGHKQMYVGELMPEYDGEDLTSKRSNSELKKRHKHTTQFDTNYW